MREGAWGKGHIGNLIRPLHWAIPNHNSKPTTSKGFSQFGCRVVGFNLSLKVKVP